MKMKIMTFNVLNGWNTTHIGERDDLAAAAILQQTPDVLCLQEFDPCYRMAEQPLQQMIAPLYVEAGEEHTTWNPIFYNKERVRLLAFGEERFEKGTEYNYPKGGRSGFRTVCHALLEDVESATRFLLLNLRYDTSKEWQTTVENQESESHQVLLLAKELMAKHSACALFVTGDYNAKIGGISCTRMLENGFLDTHALALEKDDKGTCSRLGEPLWGDYAKGAIDHVFYMGEGTPRVLAYETLEEFRAASDHAPVCVTVELE